TVGQRAGQITPQLKYLAEECVRSIEDMDAAIALLGEERLQGGLRFERAPEVCARQGPPHAAQAGCGGTPDRFPQPGNLRKLAERALGGGPGRSEAADGELRVRQHGAHLELEPRVDSFGELQSVFRACEVLRHVAGEPTQASVGREQERVPCRVLKSFGDRLRLVEEAPCLALLYPGDAADLEQRAASGEVEHQGLARLRNGGKAIADPT